MTRSRPRNTATAVATLAVLFIILVSSAGLTPKRTYGIVLGPATPSWILPGEYVEYNQTYVVEGLTASVTVKDTLLNSSGQMLIQKLDPHVATGFSMADLVSSSDSGTIGVDPTVFCDPAELAYTNASIVSLHVAGPASAVVQAWKVNETRLNLWIYGMTGGAIINSSNIWFEKNLSIKVRESSNYTNPVLGHYIVSVERIVDTNIPQLKPDLMSQASSSQTTSPATGAASLFQNYVFDGLVLFALGVVATVTVVSYLKGKKYEC